MNKSFIRPRSERKIFDALDRSAMDPPLIYQISKESFIQAIHNYVLEAQKLRQNIRICLWAQGSEYHSSAQV